MSLHWTTTYQRDYSARIPRNTIQTSRNTNPRPNLLGVMHTGRTRISSQFRPDAQFVNRDRNRRGEQNRTIVNDLSITGQSVQFNQRLYPQELDTEEQELDLEGLEPVRIYLSLSAFEQLETKRFQTSVCSVCQENYKHNQKITTLPCSHLFHRRCIKEWLTKNSVFCPLCRFDCRESF